MSSGQWDLQALEAIEREASEIFDVLDVPERLRSPANKQQKQQNNCAGSKKMPPCRSFCGGGSDQHHHGSGASSPIASAASATAATDENMDFELQDHIKHCSCSCNHMGYGNYMDYQVGGWWSTRRAVPLIKSRLWKGQEMKKKQKEKDILVVTSFYCFPSHLWPPKSKKGLLYFTSQPTLR